MANKTIGELPEATTPLNGDELMHGVQGGNSRRMTVDHVRGPKLKSLVDLATAAGDLIYGLSTGLLARLPKGTAGQVLRMNAAATSPEWGPPIAFAPLLSGTVTNAPSLDISLANFAEYQTFEVYLTDFTPAVSGFLMCRLSTDGGATFLQSSGYYTALVKYYTQGGAAPGGETQPGSSTNQSGVAVSQAVGADAAAGGTSGKLTIMGAKDAAKRTKVLVDVLGFESTGVLSTMKGGGSHGVAAAHNAIRLVFLSGNIASGSYAVYGIR